MKEYKVLASEIIGLRGAKYKEGTIVKDSFFPPNHAKLLVENGMLEEVVKEAPKKSKKD